MPPNRIDRVQLIALDRTAAAARWCRLFGAEVQPRFDKDPVHSTTRYREAALKKGAARAAVS